MSTEKIRATVDALLALLPMSDDGTGHVADCGWNEWDGTCGCFTLPGRMAEVIAALMPEASETVEWGVRYARDSVTYPISERGARELAAEGYDTTPMQRAVWRGEWTEVTDA